MLPLPEGNKKALRFRSASCSVVVFDLKIELLFSFVGDVDKAKRWHGFGVLDV